MHGIIREVVGIVPIGMPTRDPEDPLPDQVLQRVPDLARLPVVHQALREPVDQPVLSLRRLQ